MATIDKIKFDKLLEELPNKTDREKRDLLLTLRRLKNTQSNSKSDRKAPTTDDELWLFIKEELGYEIPRVAVCEDHTAPFDFMADYYFERENSILVLGGRESGKTAGVAIINYINCETKPGCECCTFADIEAQSNKSYSYIKSFIYYKDQEGKKVAKPSIDGEPLRKETRWKNGSKLEVIIGSKSGVNSPHPQKVHADEIDLMEREIFAESRNMSSSGRGTDGRLIKAQDIATSTRKTSRGLMQELIDETKDAEKIGRKPIWKLYASCIFEVAEEVPCCKLAPQADREDRLKKLGKDPKEECECEQIVKGEWGEKNPRTLESVCKGKLFRSRGWMRYEDVIRKFTQNAPNVWVAQMECRRPMADGLYLPTWTRERYVVQGYEPRPEFGLIWTGTDWGGTEASFVVWIQGPLNQSIEVKNTIGGSTVIPKGGYVIFKELSEVSMGATRLAAKVVRQEIQYKNKYPGWRVKARFADMAGKQQRLDWHEHNPPLRTVWYISRDFDPTVECVQALVADSLLYVDGKEAPNLCDDFESWRQDNGKEVHDQSSHGPAATRYALKNITTTVKRNTKTTVHAVPIAVTARESTSDAGQASLGMVASQGAGEFESDRWRQARFGPGDKPRWMP